ncbi:MAG: UDP-N-acetylglucosamine 2-epimerase (non-hydrolyzing) [Pelagibacteraceae bacterium TMED124]|nr:MAG: UDP-N-acetylglucosamine 2-epimerase (non-hydrolyzing) [Pelagibacteraceae bacterium TMED124]|tara:strand:+ start:3130 stop:4254 length:1125 start_codon:yes stop_codon:yes gene_type:complete
MTKRQKILFVFGTRPEAIKLAPLISIFDKNNKFKTIVCTTGQHKEMLKQVIDFFKIKVDYDLKLMKKNQTLNSLSSKIIKSVDKIILKENPSYVFVHGDTSTTAFASIASFHNQIKICHVEAGLRTYNKFSPFPEEINRTITGKLADYHFAPTKEAMNNLIKENVDRKNISVTGNTVIDALDYSKKIVNNYKNQEINSLKKILNKSKKIILVTGHRRENFGKGFEDICDALLSISKEKNVEIVYPVHLNPNVKDLVNEKLGGASNIHLTDPLNYPAFMWMMSKSYLILTDSGGIQEEAPSFHIPALVMRNTTERPEGIEKNTAILVGTDKDKIISTTKKFLYDENFYKSYIQKENPYGDGKASEKIINFIIKNG